jgi:hypothetical protein
MCRLATVDNRPPPGVRGDPRYLPWQTSLSGPSTRAERMVSSPAPLDGVARRRKPNPGRSIAVEIYRVVSALLSDDSLGMF